MPSAPSTSAVRYGGFWVRLSAHLWDYLFLSLTSGLLLSPLQLLFKVKPSVVIWAAFGIQAILEIAFWMYKGATPGKILCNLRIVNAKDLGPLTLGQCLIRYLFEVVSMILLFLGFLWVGFDARKQGWHDKAAGTLVIVNPNGRWGRGWQMVGLVFAAIALLGMVAAIMVPMAARSTPGARTKEDVTTEGAVFGHGKTDDQCLKETLRRYDACVGPACATSTQVFLAQCLGQSQRTPDFCTGVPPVQMKSFGWTLNLCGAGPSSVACTNRLVEIQNDCSSERGGSTGVAVSTPTAPAPTAPSPAPAVVRPPEIPKTNDWLAEGQWTTAREVVEAKEILIFQANGTFASLGDDRPAIKGRYERHAGQQLVLMYHDGVLNDKVRLTIASTHELRGPDGLVFQNNRESPRSVAAAPPPAPIVPSPAVVTALAYQANKGVPQKLDDETELSSVTPEGMKVLYHFRLVKRQAAALNAGVVTASLTKNLAQANCKNDVTRELLSKGVILEYRYADKDGQPVTTIDIDASSCAGL